MRHRRSTIIGVCLALALGAAACGSDDSDSSDGADTGTGSQTTAAAGTGTTIAGDDESATSDGPCPAETDIAIRNSDDIDGDLELETSFADIVLDASGDLVFATYEMEADEQFGLRAPVGDPGAPEGGIIFQVSLFPGVDEEFAEGVYVDDDAAEPRITFISLYDGSSRILPLGDHTVTITEVTDDYVCGEITAETDPNDFQSFPVVEGVFVLDRI